MSQENMTHQASFGLSPPSLNSRSKSDRHFSPLFYRRMSHCWTVSRREGRNWTRRRGCLELPDLL